MLKRKLTLGLMVFMVGVLITACGSKSSSGNTAAKENTNAIPTSFDQEGTCESCSQTISGTFRISDGDLYMQAFGYRPANDIQIGSGSSSVFGQILGSIATSILVPSAGVAICGARIWLTEEIAEWAGVDDFDAECTTEDLSIFDGTNNNIFNNGGGSNNNGGGLNSSYPARLVVQYRDYRVDRVGLEVQSGMSSGGYDREVFNYDRSNIYVNDENSLLITNSSGLVRFSTTGGAVIGEFRN